MSDSKKARYSQKGKLWKDTVYAARCQAQARSRRKRRRAQQERSRGKVELLKEKA